MARTPYLNGDTFSHKCISSFCVLFNHLAFSLHLLIKIGRHESKFIKEIVEKVLSEVNETYLNVAKHPVGIDSRVASINSLLCIGSNDIRIGGIYGLGGVGKSTIAKAVYNQSFHLFKGHCFIANVREVSEQPNGLVHIQEQILSEILMEKNFKVRNVDRGIGLIRERLRSKRVLIILDDLDKLSQVNALAEECNWFGPGSRIIITTRDEHLLNQAKVDWRYKVESLHYKDSLKLFSLHAFKTTTPSDDYLELSKSIVYYAGGLPLALEVLGCYLTGRTREEWESAFKKLQQIPHDQIQRKLKISFDGLDADVKAIFLHIACFFVGMHKDFTRFILNGCGFYSEIGTSELTNRSLLKVDYLNKVSMHNLVRDMGRAIVFEESPREPGKRSRLWFHEDILDVLEKHKGTEAIEGIVPTLCMSKEMYISTKTFAGMRKLRLLKINNVQVSGSFELMLEDLVWLCWHHCPLNCLPSHFHPENLVALDMQHSKFDRVWKGIKLLESLKILNLSHSNCLKMTPDFTGVPRLETLLLKGCTNLLKVHPSIGLLDGLAHLNLKNCKKLRKLPDSICSLRSLEYLTLAGCSNLEVLPEKLGNMECLRELFADGTAIKQLPLSLGLLTNLTTLFLNGCNKNEPANSWSWVSFFPWLSRRRTLGSIRFLPPSISSLRSLRHLHLRNCNLSERDIPVDIGNLSVLEALDLGGNSFRSLPSSLNLLSNLVKLTVDMCESLQSLPELPPYLGFVNMNHCTSMEKLPNLSDMKRHITLNVQNCFKLAAILPSVNFNSPISVGIDCRSEVVKTYTDSYFQGYPERVGILDVFRHQRTRYSVSFDVPLHIQEDFRGVVVDSVYVAKEDGYVSTRCFVVQKTYTSGVQQRFCFSLLESLTQGKYSFFSGIASQCSGYTIQGGERIVVCFEVVLPPKSFELIKCEAHVLYSPNSCSLEKEVLVGKIQRKRGRECDLDLVKTSNKLAKNDASSSSARLRVELDDPSFNNLEMKLEDHFNTVKLDRHILLIDDKLLQRFAIRNADASPNLSELSLARPFPDSYSENPWRFVVKGMNNQHVSEDLVNIWR